LDKIEDSNPCHTYITGRDESGNYIIRDSSGNGWSYNNDTNTLTLDNFSGSGLYARVASRHNNQGKYKVPFNIVLIGANTFTTKNFNAGQGASVVTEGAVVSISGLGTLNVNSEENGIYVNSNGSTTLQDVDGSLTVKNSATVNVKATGAAIGVSGELIIDRGCTLIVESTSDTFRAGGAGCLFVNGTFIASTNYKYEAFSGVQLVLGEGVVARFGDREANAMTITIPAPNHTSERYGLVSTLNFGDTAYAKPYMEFRGVSTPPPSANPLDSASSWAKAGITAALAKGFVPTDIQSSYTNTITRAEFCRMAVKWLEYKLGKDIDAIVTEKGIAARASHTFSDTTDPAILAAYRLGVTAGSVAPTATSPGQFNPSGQFTRLEAAMMIMNACGVAGMDVANAPQASFADMDKAASWAHPGINFVHANGIMSGDGTNFLPAQTYSREQSILTFNNVE
jgi:hypothetical protein